MSAELSWLCIVLAWWAVSTYLDAGQRARFEIAPMFGYATFAGALLALTPIVPRQGLIMLCCILGAPLAAIGALLVASGVSVSFLTRRKPRRARVHSERQA